jgi:Tfp pilus assembly protein FimT
MGHMKKEPAGSFFCLRGHAAGFSLVEAVMIISIAAVLALVALPKFMDNAFTQARVYDEAAAALRFAQNSALAMQRTVCVTFTGSNTITLTYDPNYGGTTCTLGLAPPAGTAPYTVSAPAGTTIIAAPGNFNFDRTGRPSAGQVVTAGGKVINVIATSGYVQVVQP